jgi:hypothetical protein
MSINIAVPLPDPFADKKTKDSKEYGKLVCQYILGATAEYRERRKKRFYILRALADGKQDLKPILDMASIDGKDAYTNLSLKPTVLAKKFEHLVVDGYMENKKEYFKVTALSKHIQDKRTKKRQDAEFRMEEGGEGGLIQQMSEKVGFPLEDPKAFTPTSKEELDVYMALNDKEKEELLFEELLSFTATDIDTETLKRRILAELFKLNLCGTYNYIDTKGRQKVDIIQGEDCVYSHSYMDDFKDIHYAGRQLRMTVSRLRSIWKVTEEDEREFFKAVTKSSNTMGIGWMGEWKDDYRQSGVRPYDENMVLISHIWMKMPQVQEYLEGKDRFGRSVFDTSYDIGSLKPKATADGRKKVGRLYLETAYEGYFIGDYNFALEWKEQENIMKSGLNEGEIICPFIFHMVDNDGRMESQSPLEAIQDYIQLMDLQILKIKQVVASAPPQGLIVDIRGLKNLSLGAGKTVEPLEVLGIYRQTGDLYYNGIGEDGAPVAPPIRQIETNITNQIAGFIQVYNFALGMVRDVLGVNEFRDGTASGARISGKFAQAQQEASNTATLNLYRGFLKIFEVLGKQVGIRIWNELKRGNPNKGYLLYLGKQNSEFIKSREEITQSVYDFKVELGITADELVDLQQNIAICLQAGTLYPEDPIKIKELALSGNLKLAEKHLTFLSEKRRKERQAEQQANNEANANLQAQSGVAVEQERQKTFQMEGEVILAKEKAKAEGLRDGEMEKLAWRLIELEASTGKPIPTAYMGIIQAVLTNRGLNVEQQTEQKTQELEAQGDAMQQQQMIEEVQQAVQNGELTEEEGMAELQAAGVQI